MNTPAMLKAQTNSLKWNVHKNLLKYNLNVYATKTFSIDNWQQSMLEHGKLNCETVYK